MKTTKTMSGSALLPLLCTGIFLCLMIPQSHGQQRVFKVAEVFVTSPATDQLLSNVGFVPFEALEQPNEDFPTIMIDLHKTFQTIEGFGGAFTDASAITFAKLPKTAQTKFLKASFDPVEGNGYTLCRTTIHSCDYSDESYTYDDVPGDTELKHFTIAHDQKYRIPFIKAALQTAQGNLKLFASPWSPPAWMKDNNDMLYGGKLKPEYDQTWADYFVKYFKAYQAEGIPMWGLTVQNEAMAVQVWESCVYTAAEEKNFVRDYLGPTMKANGLGNVKIMIWDHNRGIMYQRAEIAYDDPQAAQYIWGMAYHWYVGNHFDNVRMVHDAFPDKKLLYTEAGMDGSWRSALNLAKNMIIDLNDWANGFTFWNLLLDENGGPRHAGGSPSQSRSNIVTADTKTGELTFNPPYYVFGQFSRFIKPGAKRIACTSSSDDFLATSFVNPDGKIVVVLFNLRDYNQNLQVWVENRAVKLRCPADAVMTLVL